MDKSIILKLQQYIAETLEISLKITAWESARTLPPYLRNNYEYFETDLLNQKILLIVSSEGMQNTPAIIKKHITTLMNKWDMDIIYVDTKMTSYNRKRLIGYKIPFIIPCAHMYLPMKGIDLREHFNSLHKVRSVISPSAQVLLLYCIYTREKNPNPAGIAKRLSYSNMTLTRAFNEFEKIKIAESVWEGNERKLKLSFQGKQLWEKIKEYLIDPVKKRIFAKTANQLPKDAVLLSGLSALSKYSLITEPSIPAFAIYHNYWEKVYMNKNITILPEKEPGSAEIEIWRYDPKLFQEKDTVDRLSLYLTLQQNPNERIQTALKKMLGDFEW